MKNKGMLLAFIISVIVSTIFLYPVIFDMNNKIAGFNFTNEPYGVIWCFWWLKFAFLHKIPMDFMNTIAYPFGITTTIVPVYPLWGLLAKYLTIFTNEIFAYNSLLLLSFPLSMLTMYMLMFYLSRNMLVSIFSALIYSFCPFHFVRVWQHLGTAQIQWMPLYILALFRLHEKPSFKFSLFLALALILNYYYDVYYAYFMLMLTVLFFAAIIFRKEEFLAKVRFTKFLILGVAVGAILIIPVLLPFLSTLPQDIHRAASVRSLVRPFDDLFAQSARPLSYILPFTEQPIFGGFTKMFTGTDLWGTSITEHNIFLGFIPMFLALLAFIKRKEISLLLRLPRVNPKFILFFSFALVIFSWVFSQPPWWDIFGFRLYMPAFFMYKLLPMFRAYVRWGIVVMLGVSILAGFGLLYVSSKVKTSALRIVLVVSACFFGLFEFWSIPKDHTINLANYPAVYDWLKKQDDSIVIAEYPIESEGPNEVYKFYQTKHRKKIINGTLPGTYANKIISQLTKLSEPPVTNILKWMGVKYVLVHRSDYLKTGLAADAEEVDKIQTNSELKLFMHFPEQRCVQNEVRCVQEAGPIDVYMLGDVQHEGRK